MLQPTTSIRSAARGAAGAALLPQLLNKPTQKERHEKRADWF